MTDATKTVHPCRLYLVSPPQLDVAAFSDTLRDALRAGDVGCFQLRVKEADDASIKAAARALLPICHAHDVTMLINDRPDIAMEVGADGAHLGQEDLDFWPISKTRQLMGDAFVIGVSCHDSGHLAMEAGDEGADYVAFGAFYPTTSKTPEKLAKYGTPKADILTWWYQYTVLPSVAIGGIMPENCPPLVAAGADFIAPLTAYGITRKAPPQR
jgi:thiamine-phosphate pyrophosphorylase